MKKRAAEFETLYELEIMALRQQFVQDIEREVEVLRARFREERKSLDEQVWEEVRQTVIQGGLETFVDVESKLLLHVLDELRPAWQGVLENRNRRIAELSRLFDKLKERAESVAGRKESSIRLGRVADALIAAVAILLPFQDTLLQEGTGALAGVDAPLLILAVVLALISIKVTAVFWQRSDAKALREFVGQVDSETQQHRQKPSDEQGFEVALLGDEAETKEPQREEGASD